MYIHIYIYIYISSIRERFEWVKSAKELPGTFQKRATTKQSWVLWVLRLPLELLLRLRDYVPHLLAGQSMAGGRALHYLGILTTTTSAVIYVYAYDLYSYTFTKFIYI